MNSGNSGAERRAIARDLPAIKAIAESCDELRREWEHDGGDVSKWDVSAVTDMSASTPFPRHPFPPSWHRLSLPGCKDLSSLGGVGCRGGILGLANLEYVNLASCEQLLARVGAAGVGVSSFSSFGLSGRGWGCAGQAPVSSETRGTLPRPPRRTRS